MRDIRKKNLRNIVIGHHRINSIRKKFDLLVEQIKGNIHVLVVSLTKFDKSFPIFQFEIPGYPFPFRLVHEQYGEGIFLFARADISVKFLSPESKAIKSLYRV